MRLWTSVMSARTSSRFASWSWRIFSYAVSGITGNR
jgi:hypothetical protein